MLEIAPKSWTRKELTNHIWTIRPIDQLRLVNSSPSVSERFLAT